MREMNAAAAAAETAASLKSLKQNNNKNLFFYLAIFSVAPPENGQPLDSCIRDAQLQFALVFSTTKR